jgi:hypothetical protein
MWSSRRALRHTFIALSCFTIVGCGASAESPLQSAANLGPAMPPPPADATPNADILQAGETPGAPAAMPADLAGRAQSTAPARGADANAKTDARAKDERPNVFIVYTGDLAMTTQGAVAESADKIIDTAEALGGHLAGRTDNAIKVKVPSARFRDALVAIAKLGDVTRQSVTADDVTAQFKDLEVRVQNLRATRKRLEEFLAKAPSVNEMLTVERELERVATELDAIEGRLRYLRDATSFSVLTVTLTKRAEAQVAQVVSHTSLPKPQMPDMPVEWLSKLGIDTLLTLK